MPKVLTVDDSKAIRLIVSRHLEALDIDVEQAEDGERGLEKLDVEDFDLVLLDVTMPNLDGPGMLRRMREQGDDTPVLMLTSESKKSIMVEVMKLGIEDYILKPFKADEIQAKVKKILERRPAAPSDVATEPAADAGRQSADVLVIDDMANVEKKLRAMLPARVSIHGALDKQSALALCRDNTYRAILLDTDMPDTDSKALIGQLRVLVPKAPIVALCMRTRLDAERWAKQRGYDDALYKPFTSESLSEWLLRHFDDQALVVANDNLVSLGAYGGPDSGIEKYYARVVSLLNGAFENLAAACFDQAIVDISRMPLSQERTPRFVLDVHKRTSKFGLELRIVGTDEGQRILQQFTDTGAVPFYRSVSAARSAG